MRSEVKKVTWKNVQLKNQLYRFLLIGQLLNWQFSKIRPFLKSMDKAESTDSFRNVDSCSVFSQSWKKDRLCNFW